MSATPETYSLGVRCPHCGALARVQATAPQISRWLSDPPVDVVLVTMCHFQIRARNEAQTRQCNARIYITAGDFQAASRAMQG